MTKPTESKVDQAIKIAERGCRDIVDIEDIWPAFEVVISAYRAEEAEAERDKLRRELEEEKGRREKSEIERLDELGLKIGWRERALDAEAKIAATEEKSIPLDGYTVNDPAVTCERCGKTFVCDPMDAVCRMCNKPFDPRRDAEFGIAATEEK